MSRKSDYTPKTADTICRLLIEGNSLRQICSAKDMPDRETVLRWIGANEEFAAKYARAREAQGDYMDDLILETANASTSETAAADRVKIGAYQWRAAKLMPKKYGEKVQTEVSGPDGGPILVASDADRARALAAFLAKTKAGSAE